MLVGKKVLQEEGTKLPKSYRDLKYKSNGSRHDPWFHIVSQSHSDESSGIFKNSQWNN